MYLEESYGITHIYVQVYTMNNFVIRYDIFYYINNFDVKKMLPCGFVTPRFQFIVETCYQVT